MNRYVNLMSKQSRIREIRRTRLRQWTRALLVLAAILLAPTLAVWRPVHQQGKRLAALQTQYEPIRQLISENKEFRKKIDQALEQDRLALALSNQTPVVTLLGMIGQAVAAANGEVFVQRLAFEQDSHPWEESDQTPSTVTLVSLASTAYAAPGFLETWKTIVPFAAAQLVASETTVVEGNARHGFTLKSTF